MFTVGNWFRCSRTQYSIAFCADSFKFNDYELLDLFDRRRADEASHDDLNKVRPSTPKAAVQLSYRTNCILPSVMFGSDTDTDCFCDVAIDCG